MTKKTTPKKADKSSDMGVSPREQCYARVISAVREGLAAYYRIYPDRIADSRAEDAHDHSMAGIKAILSVLDEYDIQALDKPFLDITRELE